ncbi:MAG: hypothetical protein LUH55_03350 [Bacteroides thetaiotaomicron]|nr:hypothetical protein [Bacteroides thetaiotaomicron]
MDGVIVDGAVSTLIYTLVEHNPGLCVITSRKHIDGLNRYEGMTCKTLELGNLSDGESEKLLRKFGVKADSQSFRLIFEKYKGHALTLCLLGAYVRDNLDGRLDDTRFDLYAQDRVTGNTANDIMRYYDSVYKDKAPLKILRLLSVFDRAVTYSELCALLENEPIMDLTDDLPDPRGLEWGAVLRSLKNAQLVMEYRIDSNICLDVHPMIREYYAAQLRNSYHASFLKINEYLAEFYFSRAEECTEEYKKADNYFRAVIHGCNAEKYAWSYEKIYLPKIKKYEIAHDARVLGGYGTNLDAVSGFFIRRWDCLKDGIELGMASDLYAEVSFALMCMGEIHAAIRPLEKAIETEKKLGDLKKLATYYGNLSELYLLEGRARKSRQIAYTGVQTAKLCNNIGRHNWAQMTKYANVLSQCGKPKWALAVFSNAEELQREHDESAQCLYGILAYKMHDIMLTDMEDSLLLWRLGLDENVKINAEEIVGVSNSIESAIKHDLKSKNNLHLGAVLLSQVRMDMIKYCMGEDVALKDIEKKTLKAIRLLYRGERKEYIVYAFAVAARFYDLYGKKEKADKYLGEAKAMSLHCGFKTLCVDIDIEATIQMIRHGDSAEAKELYERIQGYGVLNEYKKRNKILLKLADILKTEWEDKTQ